MDFTIISFAIPNNVPLPRYRLFQQVQVTGDDRTYTGQIHRLRMGNRP